MAELARQTQLGAQVFLDRCAWKVVQSPRAGLGWLASGARDAHRGMVVDSAAAQVGCLVLQVTPSSGLLRKAAVEVAGQKQQEQAESGGPFPFHHPSEQVAARVISLGMEAWDGHSCRRFVSGRLR